MESQNQWNKASVLVWPIGALLIVLLALLVAQKGYDISQIRKSKPNNTLSVSAEGKVNATPDLAIINLGVTLSGKTASEVQKLTTERTNKISEFIRSKGVAKEDVTTSQFNLNPTYDYREGQSIITGYQAFQSITVKVRGVDKSQETLNSILGGVADMGSNQINGMQFTFDDPDNLRQEARKQAIQKATDKARELAAASGISLGKVVTISEGGGYSPGIMPMYSEGYGGAAMDKAIAAPNVQPGNQDVTANMTVVFEVK